jgi:hypothetical protein
MSEPNQDTPALRYRQVLELNLGLNSVPDKDYAEYIVRTALNFANASLIESSALNTRDKQLLVESLAPLHKEYPDLFNPQIKQRLKQVLQVNRNPKSSNSESLPSSGQTVTVNHNHLHYNPVHITQQAHNQNKQGIGEKFRAAAKLGLATVLGGAAAIGLGLYTGFLQVTPQASILLHLFNPFLLCKKRQCRKHKFQPL